MASITTTATPIARRYLTKVRFKLALECPTKLHYYKNKAYADKFSAANSSQNALAEEGLLIGELAKYKYWPDPTSPKNFLTIREVDQVKAHDITRQILLESDPDSTIVLAEGAALHNNLFIRADILVITPSTKTIKLVEVKSKSVSRGKKEKATSTILDDMLTKQGLPKAKWTSTFYDLAFQTYVLQCVYPDYTIVPSLLLVDKDATVDQSGINEWFTVSSRYFMCEFIRLLNF
jgi:hypothetical protein